ncbi:hypothetical protein JW916_03380, partial [Candidatus Sumerlaeota bacterium]|nr:hypothetical protein [Candidatus Sumerlaeota bacterium]
MGRFRREFLPLGRSITSNPFARIVQVFVEPIAQAGCISLPLRGEQPDFIKIVIAPGQFEFQQ